MVVAVVVSFAPCSAQKSCKLVRRPAQGIRAVELVHAHAMRASPACLVRRPRLQAALLARGRTVRQAKLFFYAKMAEKGLATYERDGWGEFPTQVGACACHPNPRLLPVWAAVGLFSEDGVRSRTERAGLGSQLQLQLCSASLPTCLPPLSLCHLSLTDQP